MTFSQLLLFTKQSYMKNTFCVHQLSRVALTEILHPPPPSEKRCYLGNSTSALERIDKKLGRVEIDLGRVDKNLGRVDKDLGRVDKDLGQVDKNSGRVDKELGRVGTGATFQH